MADNVQVDGIKKLGEEEKKRSREIVLETIGEKESPPLPKPEPSSINKRLDGILGFSFGKKKETVEPVKPEPVIDQKQKAAWQKEIKEIIPVPAAPATKEDVKEDVKKITASAPAKIFNFLQDIKPRPKIETKIAPPPVVKTAPTPILKKKVEKVAKVREDKNKVKRIFWKRKKIPAKYGQFPMSKLSLQAKNKIARQSRLQGLSSFTQNWHDNSKHFEERINIIVRSSLCWLGVFLGITIVVYFLLVVTIIKTGADNSILRLIDKRLIIPALITPDGVIDFYQYQDVKNKFNLDSASAKKVIIQQLVINNLYRRLRVNPNKTISELSKAIVADREINRVPLERIKKINELITQGNDFFAVAKYGDDFVQLNLTSANRDQYSFSDQISSLNAGEISRIIYSTDGYYIFKVISKNDTDQQLAYVFIRSKSLTDYLAETVNDYKIISFVN